MCILLKYLLLCSVVYGFFHNNILPRTNYIGKKFMKELYSPQRKYHISPMMYEQYLSSLNIYFKGMPTGRSFEEYRKGRAVEGDNTFSPKNSTIQDNSILGIDDFEENNEINIKNYIKKYRKYPLSPKLFEESVRRMNNRKYPLSQKIFEESVRHMSNITKNKESDEEEQEEPIQRIRIIINTNNDDETFEKFKKKSGKKSENFEVITDYHITFKDIGGYDNIKLELEQCVDILKNYTKYSNYNVRVPKGLIFEGPPGNGKTLIAKALAGEAKVGFIPVSGSQFQDKYVGVGSSRIRELFELAKKHVPCIIFIDEIDALGRKRSGDGETSGSERDSTLNELLVALDGFKNATGVFLIGATNRVDLLDPALLRPGRIDKKMYIGEPDSKTRKAILDIHTRGKPCDSSVNIPDLVDLTKGLSGAQIENLVNEAMLNALRCDRMEMTHIDIDNIMNKMMVGWQPTEHQFTSNIIDSIAIHEMGHVILGLLSKHHSKVSKVTINLSSPKSPAYTVFESSISNIYTREGLFEHLMILLSGRIAEEVFYGVSVTTGAINDFEEALKLAEKMIVYYGMGKNIIYPRNSEKYKQMIDDEVLTLINSAYSYAEFIIRNSKDFIQETAEMLKRDKIIRANVLNDLINNKYSNILALKMSH